MNTAFNDLGKFGDPWGFNSNQLSGASGGTDNWWDKMGGGEGLGSILGGVGSLAGAGMSFMKMGQDKDKFEYMKEIAAKNAEMQRNSQLMGMQNQMEWNRSHRGRGFNSEQQRIYETMKNQRLA